MVWGGVGSNNDTVAVLTKGEVMISNMAAWLTKGEVSTSNMAARWPY